MALIAFATQSSPQRHIGWLVLSLALVAPVARAQTPPNKNPSPPAKLTSTQPTPADAKRFIEQAETRLLDLWIKSGRASWVAENFITDDTESITADADQAVKAVTSELANQAKKFDQLRLPPDVARKFMLLKLSVAIPSPHDPAGQAELAKIAASLDGDYGKGTWCQDDKKENCKQLPDIEKILANSRDPKELLAAWQGWHAIAPPMRKRYIRLVELGNQGAKEMGFADVGAMWRSNYDMPPDDFSKELDRLWQQVRPLYVSLHAYVRWKLAEKYGKDAVPEDAPIPAHLLGNMWAQEWNNIYPMLAPANATTGPDVGAALQAKHVDAKAMVHYGEAFFTSLVSSRCLRHFGSARSSRSPAIAMSSATPAPGALTTRMTCGSRCASTLPRRISPRFTTNSATISTSAPTTISPRSFRTAPTTVSTRPSATPSLFQ